MNKFLFCMFLCFNAELGVTFFALPKKVGKAIAKGTLVTNGKATPLQRFAAQTSLANLNFLARAKLAALKHGALVSKKFCIVSAPQRGISGSS